MRQSCLYPAGRRTEIKALFDKHRAAVYFYLRLASSHWFSAPFVSLAVVHTKRHFRREDTGSARAFWRCGVEQEPRVEIRLQGLHHHYPTSVFLQRSGISLTLHCYCALLSLNGEHVCFWCTGQNILQLQIWNNNNSDNWSNKQNYQQVILKISQPFWFISLLVRWKW